MMYALQIMSHMGHEKKEYDPTNQDQIREIKEFIKDKISKGWNLYGETKEGELILLRNVDDIDDEKLAVVVHQ